MTVSGLTGASGLEAVRAAEAAAEAVRELNRVTLGPAGYEWPSDVDAVIGSLLTMVRRLPQALGQAARWLERAHRAGRVGHDRDRDADTAVRVLLSDLAAARRGVEDLEVTLACARETSSHLTGITPADQAAVRRDQPPTGR